MHTIITGLVIASLGAFNLLAGRRRAKTGNSGIVVGLGWVGLACGTIVAVVGLVEVLRSNP